MTEPTEAMIAAGTLVFFKLIANKEIDPVSIYLAMEAARIPDTHRASSDEVERETLDAIAVMMAEFVDNWPEPKKVKTALALIAKTVRAALDPPKHDYWGAGEPDCPREIKAGNGELHTLRCKVCGNDNPLNDRCLAAMSVQSDKGEG